MTNLLVLLPSIGRPLDRSSTGPSPAFDGVSNPDIASGEPRAEKGLSGNERFVLTGVPYDELEDESGVEVLLDGNRRAALYFGGKPGGSTLGGITWRFTTSAVGRRTS